MKVIFPIEHYKRLRAYVDGIKYEISGLGKIETVGDTFLVSDIKIFKQTVTGGNTILNKNALGKFWDELIKNNEDPGKWKLWWHSHGDMDAFFSTTDEATIEDFDNEAKQDNWLLSLVTNREGKTLIRSDIFAPFRLTVENITWDLSFEDEPLKNAVLDEIMEKVEIIGSKPKGNGNGTDWRHRSLLKLPFHLPDLDFNTAGEEI